MLHVANVDAAAAAADAPAAAAAAATSAALIPVSLVVSVARLGGPNPADFANAAAAWRYPHPVS